jgi:ankyrin repeat protein
MAFLLLKKGADINARI